jgi:tRNA(Ile)-lysidine synthase
VDLATRETRSKVPFMLWTRVRRTIERHGLIRPGERVIAAVSGGVDSMVLLHLLARGRQDLEFSLTVAHLSHGFRPEDADRERALVERACRELTLPFESRAVDARGFARERGVSPQMAARRLRFDFLDELARKQGGQKIALGHHADDQAETVLLRLLRGAGLRGLKGMLPMREGRVIRPLLEVSRADLESFASLEGIPFLTDPSNLKESYLRNRLRLSLIPLIEREYQPRFRDVLGRTSALLREENDFLETEAEAACRRILTESEEGVTFSLADFRRCHPGIQWRILCRILERHLGLIGLEEAEEGSLVSRLRREVLQPSPCLRRTFAPELTVDKCYDRVFLGKRTFDPPTMPFERVLPIPGEVTLEEIGSRIVAGISSRPEEEAFRFTETAFLDAARVKSPLEVRNFRPGDRFRPLGGPGVQKLKEFFIDHKVPRFERTRIPLVLSGEEIVWVAGYRICEGAKVTATTVEVVRLDLQKLRPGGDPS